MSNFLQRALPYLDPFSAGLEEAKRGSLVFWLDEPVRKGVDGGLRGLAFVNVLLISAASWTLAIYDSTHNPFAIGLSIALAIFGLVAITRALSTVIAFVFPMITRRSETSVSLSPRSGDTSGTRNFERTLQILFFVSLAFYIVIYTLFRERWDTYTIKELKLNSEFAKWLVSLFCVFLAFVVLLIRTLNLHGWKSGAKRIFWKSGSKLLSVGKIFLVLLYFYALILLGTAIFKFILLDSHLFFIAKSLEGLF